MEIKVLEESKNKMVVEIKGEDNTFCNALKNELWNDEDVKISGYRTEHPLVGSPKIIVETTKKEPRKALIEAAKRLQKNFEKFKNSVIKEIK